MERAVGAVAHWWTLRAARPYRYAKRNGLAESEVVLRVVRGSVEVRKKCQRSGGARTARACCV